MELSTILLLAGLLALVLLGSRLGFGKIEMPAGVRIFFDTGKIFILIGWVIGPQALNLLTGSMIDHMGPLLYVGLGWIGFLYGSHFEWRRVKRFEGRLYGVAISQSLLSFAVVAFVAWMGLPLLYDGEMPFRLRSAESLILGICAMGTAPAGVYFLARQRRISHYDFDALQFFSAVDDIPSLLILAVTCAFLHPAVESGGMFFAVEWLAIPVALGLVLGIVASWVFPAGDDVRENSLVLFAMVCLGAGCAAMLGVSPLFVCAVAGMVFANIHPMKERAYGLLVQGEHALYVVFLLLAGVILKFDWRYVYFLVPAFVLLRGLSKIFGTWISIKTLLPKHKISPGVGTGLLFQGGMMFAILVSLVHSYPNDFSADYITFTIVAAVFINELITPFLVSKFLGGKVP